MHTRPDRTRRGSTLRSMRAKLRRLRYWGPLILAVVCLVAAYHVPPFVTYVLVIASFVLLFEAGTACSRARAAPAASRTSGSSAAVVEDGLDVVAVGVEHEGAVVAGVVLGPLARRAVVAVARAGRGAVERLDGRVGRRAGNAMCRFSVGGPSDHGERAPAGEAAPALRRLAVSGAPVYGAIVA